MTASRMFLVLAIVVFAGQLVVLIVTVLVSRSQRAPRQLQDRNIIAIGTEARVVEAVAPRPVVATWEHMYPAFELSETWRLRHEEFCVPVSLNALCTQLRTLLAQYAVVETPVYAYLSQLRHLPPHRVFGINYSAGPRPGTFFARRMPSGGRLRTGVDITDLGVDCSLAKGLVISTLGRLMSPTFCLMLELKRDGGLTSGFDSKSDVRLVSYDTTAEQLQSLTSGESDLAFIVYPATKAAAQDSDVRWVPSLLDSPDGGLIDRDVASLVVCSLDQRSSDFVAAATDFLQTRNVELDVQLHRDEAELVASTGDELLRIRTEQLIQPEEALRYDGSVQEVTPQGTKVPFLSDPVRLAALAEDLLSQLRKMRGLQPDLFPRRLTAGRLTRLMYPPEK